MRGNDGQMYIVITVGSKGTHRWVPVNEEKRSRPIEYTVTTIDNGGKSFRVHLTNVSGKGTAYVHVNESEEEDTWNMWKTFKYYDVFIGTDPEEPPISVEDSDLNEKEKEKDEEEGRVNVFGRIKNAFQKMGEFVAGLGKASHAWWYGGNSLLLKVRRDKNEYVFIGESVFFFATPADDPIFEYHSPVGNSAVPYPYAIGKKYTYLMIEMIFVPNSTLTSFFKEEKGMNAPGDPYVWFYEMTTDESRPKWEMNYVRQHQLPRFKLLHDRVV